VARARGTFQGMRAFAGLFFVLTACTFDTSVVSQVVADGLLDGAPAAEDSGARDAGLVADAASSDAAAFDAALPPILYVLSPTGDVEIEAEFGGEGGGDFDEDCPDGRVVTGFDGDNTSNGICRLSAFCSRLTANPDGTVTTSDPQATNLHGNSGSFFQEDPLQCPPNHVVVGANGRSNGIVRQLEIRCAPLTWDYSNTTYSVGTPTQVAGNIGSGVGGPSSGGCETGQVAGGYGGNAGTLVDRFELHCFELEATPQ